MKRVLIAAVLAAMAGCGASVGQEYRMAKLAQGFENKAEFEDRVKFANPLERDRIGKGGLLFISEGKRVRVIDTCPSGVRLEAMEGDEQGKSGWFKADELASASPWWK